MTSSERSNREFLQALLPELPTLVEALRAEGWKGRPERETVELLGMTLWDIFSHGNSVVDTEGREHDLGSFRGSAGFIAEVLQARYPDVGRFDYLDFYMGTILIARYADLRPVYRWIFRRLREAGRDWRYVFPQLLVFRPPKPEDTGWESYDPSAAVAEEFDQGKREQEFHRFQEKLALAHERELERARQAPPPAAVAVYREVFGSFPSGWPP